MHRLEHSDVGEAKEEIFRTWIVRITIKIKMKLMKNGKLSIEVTQQSP